MKKYKCIFIFSIILLAFPFIGFARPMVDPMLRQSVMASVWAKAQYQEGLASLTRVKIQNAYKNIQDLVVGDLISIPGSCELQEIVLIETRSLPYYYEVQFDKECLQVAPAQKIYDAYQNQWIEAQSLTLDDHVGIHPVVCIQKVEQYLQVYKLQTTSHIFEIEGDIIAHNFDVATACSMGLAIGQIVVQHPVLALIGRTVSLTKLAISIYQAHQEYQQQAVVLLDALIVQDVVIETRTYYEVRRKQLMELLAQYQVMQQIVQAITQQSVLGISLFPTAIARGQGIILLPALQTELQYAATEKQKLLIARQQDLVAMEKEIIDIQLSMAIYFDGLLGMYDALLADIDRLAHEADHITTLWDPAFEDQYSLHDLLYMSIKNLTFFDLYIGQLEKVVQDLSFFMNFYEQNQQASMLRQTSNVEFLCLQVRPHISGTLQYVSQLKLSVFNLQKMNYDLLQKYPVITQGTLQDFAAQAQQQLHNQNQQYKANLKIKQSQTQFSQLPDDSDENNKKKRIYEEVAYHHQNSKGNSFSGKSPPPKNGQLVLDMSILFKIKGNQGLETRLGVEGNHFVILHEHRPGFFHGNISSWEDLFPDMRTALYEAGIVKNPKTGKM